MVGCNYGTYFLSDARRNSEVSSPYSKFMKPKAQCECGHCPRSTRAQHLMLLQRMKVLFPALPSDSLQPLTPAPGRSNALFWCPRALHSRAQTTQIDIIQNLSLLKF